MTRSIILICTTAQIRFFNTPITPYTCTLLMAKDGVKDNKNREKKKGKNRKEAYITTTCEGWTIIANTSTN
jgi:hypothetical protein